MHTLKVIALGFALLAVCLLVGHSRGGLPLAAKVFILIWLVGAGINLWIGVSKAGYSVADEAPVFAIVYGIPAAVAALVWWRTSRP